MPETNYTYCMTTRISIDDQTFKELQAAGELRVENSNGVPLVVMTVDAREHLQKLAYDDSEWTEAELMAAGADQLDDPEGWGATGMDIYDTMEGIAPTENGIS
jgi:hypothetical protein